MPSTEVSLEERRAELEAELAAMKADGKDARSAKFREVRDQLAELSDLDGPGPDETSGPDRHINHATEEAPPLADSEPDDDMGEWYELGVQSYRGQQPPRESITLGGQAFSLFVSDENPIQTGDHLQYNQRRRGQRVLLWKEDIERIHDAMGHKFVRMRNASTGQGIVLDNRVRGYRKTKGDVPLECFVYMRRCEEPKPTDHEPQEVYPSLAEASEA